MDTTRYKVDKRPAAPPIMTKIKIPMLGKTESLNAAVATGVILYETVRQKEMKN